MADERFDQYIKYVVEHTAKGDVSVRTVLTAMEHALAMSEGDRVAGHEMLVGLVRQAMAAPCPEWRPAALRNELGTIALDGIERLWNMRPAKKAAYALVASSITGISVALIQAAKLGGRARNTWFGTDTPQK